MSVSVYISESRRRLETTATSVRVTSRLISFHLKIFVFVKANFIKIKLPWPWAVGCRTAAGLLGISNYQFPAPPTQELGKEEKEGGARTRTHHKKNRQRQRHARVTARTRPAKERGMQPSKKTSRVRSWNCPPSFLPCTPRFFFMSWFLFASASSSGFFFRDASWNRRRSSSASVVEMMAFDFDFIP